jgi:hypothetical protein
LVGAVLPLEAFESSLELGAGPVESFNVPGALPMLAVQRLVTRFQFFKLGSRSIPSSPRGQHELLRTGLDSPCVLTFLALTQTPTQNHRQDSDEHEPHR